jgi:hypothetical protein
MPRKQKNIHYLYKTTCNVTGRYYIGMHSTINLDDGYLGSGRRLRASIRKYGEENHTKEILGFFETRDLLVEAEKDIITEDMLGDEMCMNLMGGGNGGCQDPEKQRKWIEAGNKASVKKFYEDEEHRGKIIKTLIETTKKNHKEGKYKYDTFKGRKHSQETKDKMSQSSKGKGIGENNSQYSTCWITKDSVNKKIKKSELPDYESEGWMKGRVL